MGNLCCYLQSKLPAHAYASVAHASIENIPVVDKVVDDGWGSPRANLQASSSGMLCGYLVIVKLLFTVIILHLTFVQIDIHS
jgi:hypothetical protein